MIMDSLAVEEPKTVSQLVAVTFPICQDAVPDPSSKPAAVSHSDRSWLSMAPLAHGCQQRRGCFMTLVRATCFRSGHWMWGWRRCWRGHRGARCSSSTAPRTALTAGARSRHVRRLQRRGLNSAP